MTPATAPADQRVEEFRQRHRDTPGLYLLAVHSSLAAAVNAELLHHLRDNFLLELAPPERLAVTPAAEIGLARLLLSPLYRELGDGLWEMDPDVRSRLLRVLAGLDDGRRLHDVAALLERYTREESPWQDWPELREAQLVTAWDQLDPQAVDEWLAAGHSSGGGPGLGTRWFTAMRRRIDEARTRPEPDGGLLDAEQAARRFGPALVALRAGTRGSATATRLTTTGLLVTPAYMVEGYPDTAAPSGPDGAPAIVVAVNHALDVAFLLLNWPGPAALPVAVLGAGLGAAPGDPVVVVGFSGPQLFSSVARPEAVVSTIVEVGPVTSGGRPAIVATAGLGPGGGGGPIVSARPGQGVLGMVHSAYDDGRTIAVPAETILEALGLALPEGPRRSGGVSLPATAAAVDGELYEQVAARLAATGCTYETVAWYRDALAVLQAAGVVPVPTACRYALALAAAGERRQAEEVLRAARRQAQGVADPTGREALLAQVADAARQVLGEEDAAISTLAGDGGVAAIEAKVAEYRGGYQTDPAAAPLLALWLTNLAARLATGDPWAQAAAATQEAVELHRRLAGDDPDRQSELAAALGLLSSTLGAAGRLAESIDASREAVAVLRGPAALDPTAHAADLADALDDLSELLTETGRVDEAAMAATEAASIRAEAPSAATLAASGTLTATALPAALAELADRYVAIRRDQPSGGVRTAAMTDVVEAMRALPVPGDLLALLAAGDHPGQRLAAVVVLQDAPDPEWLGWLANRLLPEAERPFLAYQAAVALRNAAEYVAPADLAHATAAVERARAAMAEEPSSDRARVLARAADIVAARTAATRPTATGKAATGKAATPRRPAAGPRGRIRARWKLWENGQTLRVAFLDGPPRLHRVVEGLAPMWLAQANLRFEFLAFPTSAESDIRITFTEPGAWSYVGTDARSVPQGQATLCVGAELAEGGEPVFRRALLKVLGHALGLVQEHQSPNAQIPWDVEAVYRSFTGPPNHWTRETIDQNILRRYDLSGYRDFDPESVMLHDFPADLTGGRRIAGGLTLSPSDRAFVGRLYPKSPAQAAQG